MYFKTNNVCQAVFLYYRVVEGGGDNRDRLQAALGGRGTESKVGCSVPNGKM